MFNLNTGVHLNEVELAVFKQELKCTCSAVADIYTGFGATLADEAAKFRGDTRRWRFFNNFLVATLHGAVTFSQIDGVALAVRQHLNFDVTRVFQVFLHVNHIVTEGGFSFRFRHGDGLRQFSIAAHYAHTTTAAAARRFDDNRIADAFRMGTVSIHIVGQRAVRAGYGRNARFFHGGDR